MQGKAKCDAIKSIISADNSQGKEQSGTNAKMARRRRLIQE